MKIYPILSSDLYSLSCVPVSMLAQMGSDEIKAHLSRNRSLKFLVAQDTGGQIQTETGFVSKHIEYTDISAQLAGDFSLNTLQKGVASLSDYVLKNDLEQLSVIIDSLPSPYIISAFFLSSGHISHLEGYTLSDALTFLVPKLRYSSISSDTAYVGGLSADSVVSPEIDDISSKIPDEASTGNKLADKAYVSALISANSPVFRGTFDNWSVVPSSDTAQYWADSHGDRVPAQNDYMVVLNVSDYDSMRWPADKIPLAEKYGAWRFGYSGEWTRLSASGWSPQYRIEQYNFTPERRNAIDSGVTKDNFVKRQASSGRVGSGTRGVFLDSDGTLQPMTYILEMNVSSGAKLTDTTYSAGTGLKLDGTKFSLAAASEGAVGGIRPLKGFQLDSEGKLSVSTAVRVVDIESYDSSKPEDLSASAFSRSDGLTAVHIGAILIVRRGYRLSDSRQYTAYVYTGTGWEAMGGNYSADNVILPDDIEFSGEWSQVGNITNDNTQGLSALHCGGKSVSETFKMIFGSGSTKIRVHAPVVLTSFIKDNESSDPYGPFIDRPGEWDDRVTVSDGSTLTAIDPGAYTFTLNLPDDPNCEWSDGTTEPRTINWEIIAPDE